MPKKDKIINGVEHQNNTFKEQGKIYKFIEKCPLGVIIFLPLLFILMKTYFNPPSEMGRME